jgi:hypothetical protein
MIDTEQEMCELIEAWIPPGSRVLEGGSGAAYCTRALKDRQCYVVAADPVRTEAAEVADVFILGALDSAWSIKPFTTSSEWWNSRLGSTVRYGETVRTVMVPTVDVDTLIGRYGLNALVLDIEGTEVNVVEVLPSRVGIVIVETHETDQRIAHRLRARGFELCESLTVNLGVLAQAWRRT